jgi:membrane-bound metal-dependent hydrolase YbcI (DUF457 family)
LRIGRRAARLEVAPRIGNVRGGGGRTEREGRRELPTSIAHAVAGVATGRLTGLRSAKGWAGLAFVVVLANLPDADFLIGAAVGRPRDWHRGPTHTLLAAVVVALVVAVAQRRGGRGFGRAFLLAFALYGSHLVLDTIMPDRRFESGIPLFWPLTDYHVYAPLPLPEGLEAFLNIPLGNTPGSFAASLLSWHALAVFVVEGLLFLPLLVLAWALPAARERAQGKIPRSR